MSVINIVAASNDTYVPHVGAMLHSLFETNPDEQFAIYFLHRQSLDAVLSEKLAALCQRHGARYEGRAVEAAILSDLPIKGFYVEEAWYRVFMADLLPELDRVLWLDADVIVLDRIRALWETDLEGYSLAACPNALLYQYKGLVDALGIADRSDYFNTGVLLMDLAQMRREGSEQMMREAVKSKFDHIQFADQDVLNCVYHQHYKRLALPWNVLTHSYINVPETVRVHGAEEFREAMRAPRIVHFTGRENKKPWSYRCGHPYRDAYLRHREAAGWDAPEYTDKSWRTHLSRSIPLRWREVLNLAVRGQFAEMRSYLHRW